MEASIRKGGFLTLVALLLGLALAAAPAEANRALLTEEAVKVDAVKAIPPPEGQIEGACGLAVGAGEIYVSDYYHRAVHSWSASGPPPFTTFGSSISAASAPEGPCQLAVDSGGALYANLWHESVVRLLPSFQMFDEANSTGVAVDATGNIYINNRTHVVVYNSSGAQLEEIGAGTLTDAYGLAVFGGRVYVPDAATNAIQVYEPASDPITPVATITGSDTPQNGFNSLVDASVTVDPTNGHLLVLDNLQPGFEHPKAAIDEFTSTGTFLGQLKHTVIDGEPSGLVVDATGKLFATSGNSENANVFAFGPYTEGGPEAIEGTVEGVPVPSVAGASVIGVGEAVAVSVVGSAAASPAKAAERRKVKKRRAKAKRQAKRHHGAGAVGNRGQG